MTMPAIMALAVVCGSIGAALGAVLAFLLTRDHAHRIANDAIERLADSASEIAADQLALRRRLITMRIEAKEGRTEQRKAVFGIDLALGRIEALTQKQAEAGGFVALEATIGTDGKPTFKLSDVPDPVLHGNLEQAIAEGQARRASRGVPWDDGA